MICGERLRIVRNGKSELKYADLFVLTENKWQSARYGFS